MSEGEKLNERRKWAKQGNRIMPIKGNEGEAPSVVYFTDCQTVKTVRFLL